jgi:hypothetical protein
MAKLLRKGSEPLRDAPDIFFQFESYDPQKGVDFVSAFPVAWKTESLPYRHANFAISVESTAMRASETRSECCWIECSNMIRSWARGAGRSMDWDAYFRQQAAMYRQLAEKTEDVFIEQELLDLAAVCEEVANNIEDRRTSG